jgi:hypothetical protein
MKPGTKSLLFGVHQFILHPIFVALAYWHLYGFPWDPRLWLAILVHDWGYWGKPNMDGPEGEKHVELGAAIMGRLFDRGIAGFEYQEWHHGGKGVPWRVGTEEFNRLRLDGWRIFYIGCSMTVLDRPIHRRTWRNFCRYHSRHTAKQEGQPFSRLCVADKLSIFLMPAWLYLPLARMTGELSGYMGRAKPRAEQNAALTAYERRRLTSPHACKWFAGLQAYMRRWVDQHKDGAEDTWTTLTNGRHQDHGTDAA